MNPFIGLAAALILAATATSASARVQQVSPADTADMQCFALTALVGGQLEEGSPEQAGFIGGMMYFLGRLEGRTPGTDWLAGLSSFLLTVDEAEIVAQRERCGGILTERGQALIDWGEALSVAAGAAAD